MRPTLKEFKKRTCLIQKLQKSIIGYLLRMLSGNN